MNFSVRTAVLTGWLAFGLGCQSVPTTAATAMPAPETIGATVSRLTSEAAALPPLLKTRWAVEYVASVPQLVPISPRRLYASPDRRVYQSELEARAQKQSSPAMVTEWVDEAGYYTGSLGSPLFHARLIDLIAEGQLAKLAGKRSLELYPTAIGPQRLLAGTGLDAVGVSPSPRLRALYSQPGDQGPVKLPGRDVSGRVTLITGSFPADPAVRAQVGSGFEFVLAKNVLKRGYIHPTGEVAPESLMNLGMPEADYLRSLRETLRPGGRLLVYNVCPGPSPAFYDPEADCRNPWSRADWQAAGFVVRDYECNDTEAARQYAVALGFDKPPISIAIDNLYAIYSLLERP
ncbi:MAG: hypothetical protein JNM40_11220 [Myxococcales bacterium]|nr:hypothetical protein [Myxococcales bacterium]